MGVRHRIFTASLSLLFILLPVVPSAALGQTRALKIDDLAKRADVVVVGRVAELKSEWSTDKTHIVTRVTLSVQEYVKGGEAGIASVTLTTLGGEVGEVGELYTHVPAFHPNEDVVVFLGRSANGDHFVTGGTEGKFVVERDPTSGNERVVGEDGLDEFIARVRKAATQ
jgi:hypothetical protein